MDNLLCNEVWLSRSENSNEEVGDHVAIFKSYENEEFEEAFKVCLGKEVSSLPESNYAKYLHSNNLIFPRSRVIQWFIKVSLILLEFQTLLELSILFLIFMNCLENVTTLFVFTQILKK